MNGKNVLFYQAKKTNNFYSDKSSKDEEFVRKLSTDHDQSKKKLKIDTKKLPSKTKNSC